MLVEGYAIVYNEWSADLGGFYERIQRGAVEWDATTTDVLALVNHDRNLLLARLSAGTLALRDEPRGLRYGFTPADTTVANDLIGHLRRGDITGSSFGFLLLDDEWDVDDSGDVWRTITRLTLLDVSPVVSPAYPQTTVAIASSDPGERAAVRREVAKLERGIRAKLAAQRTPVVTAGMASRQRRDVAARLRLIQIDDDDARYPDREGGGRIL